MNRTPFYAIAVGAFLAVNIGVWLATGYLFDNLFYRLVITILVGPEAGAGVVYASVVISTEIYFWLRHSGYIARDSR